MWILCFLVALLGIGGSGSEAPRRMPMPGANAPKMVGSGRHNNRIQKLPDLYWNTSNPIFRIDNTDHIIDVNVGRVNTIMEYDQVNIICPLYRRTPQNEARMDQLEQYIIYAVNKEEFDMCRIMHQAPRIIAQCDAPFQYKYFTISFRSFSPTPGAIEFHSGKDYYFISTSAPGDLHQRVDGRCRDNNMKVVFKVSPKATKVPPPPPRAPRPRPPPPPPPAPEGSSPAVTRDQSRPHRRLNQRRNRKKTSPRPYDYFLQQTDVQLNDIPSSSSKASNSPPSTSWMDKKKASSSSSSSSSPSEGRSGLVKQEASTSAAAAGPHSYLSALSCVVVVVQLLR